MSQLLNNIERRVLRYHGMPARDVARAEHLTIHEVLEVRATLRSRHLVPTTPGFDRAAYEEQLSLGDIDRMMRDNAAPRADGEGGYTAAEGGW